MVHICDKPKIVYDWRQDTEWYPPQNERRPRCLLCGWQGKWSKVDANVPN